MYKIIFGVNFVWIVGLYALTWLAAKNIWPPPLPRNQFEWITGGAILIGPPLVISLGIFFIVTVFRSRNQD